MLYLFSPPKRIDDEENYIFTVLDRLNERFELGQLLRLSYWVEDDKRLFVAVFERGRVEGEFRPGEVGYARVIRRRRVGSRRRRGRGVQT
jgi:hypothetical protein